MLPLVYELPKGFPYCCSGRCGVSPQKGVAENALAFAAKGEGFPPHSGFEKLLDVFHSRRQTNYRKQL